MTVSRDRKKLFALIGVSLAAALNAVDFAIVNTALPAIQRDLTATLVQLQWIMNIFILVRCVLTVTLGRVADIYGRRLLLYIGVIVFGLGSVLAAVSPDTGWLIFARVIQGASAAIILPCSLALITSIFPKDETGRALGIWASILGSGMALGPVLGGFIISYFDWRWIFYINIPLVVLTLIICFIGLDEYRSSEKPHFDLKGLLYLTIGFSALVMAILQGQDWGWGSVRIVGLFSLSIISLVLLYREETRSVEPIIPFQLFLNRDFLAGSVANFLGQVFVWSAFFLIPLYLFNARGLDGYKVGLMMLPITVSMMIFSPLSGRLIDKFGAYSPMLIGSALFVASALIQAFFDMITPIVLISIAFVIMGIAWAFMLSSASKEALSSIPTKFAGVASGAEITVLSFGGAVGLALSGMIFRLYERGSVLSGLAGKGLELSKHRLDIVRSLLSDPERAKKSLTALDIGSPEEVLPIFKNALIHGYDNAMIFLFVVSIGSLIFVLYLIRKGAVKN